MNTDNRLSVWLHNLWHWRTRWAWRHLSKRMKRDRGYAESWQANIAMTIYDNSRSSAVINHEKCNQLADKLMSHLFDVQMGGFKAE